MLMQKDATNGSANLGRLVLVLSLPILLLATLALAEEPNDKERQAAADLAAFDRVAAERFKFLQNSVLALDRAQTRLEQMGYKNIAELRQRGYRSRPGLLVDILPFHMADINDLIPLGLLYADSQSSQGISNRNILTLIRSFNVQILGSVDTIAWPDTAVLEFSLQNGDQTYRRIVQTSMRFDERDSSYYFEDPFDAYQSLMSSVLEVSKRIPKEQFNRKPTLKLDNLSGFNSLAAELEPVYFPRGVAVTHSIRLGEVRLASGYSWLGRPQELLELASPQFIR